MSTSYWLDRSSDLSKKSAETKTFDILIIGAGLSGLSTAYWLKKEDPNLKVAIVEKSRVGFGASGRNAGFITCGSVEHFNRLHHKYGEKLAAEIWKFSETNLELLKENIIQDQQDVIHFEQKGTFSLASTPPECEELRGSAQLMKSLGIEVEELDEAAITSRLGVQGFVGGIKYLRDACVNPAKLLELLRKRANVEIFESTEVFSIERNGDSRLVKTDNGTFDASMVVAALNGYSSSLFPYFEDKIFPTRGQILVTEPTERFMEGPCYANFYLDYFRQLTTGEILIGGFRQLEKETEVGYSDHITKLIQTNLEQFIREHIPAIKDKKITHRWGGVMGFSVDGQPMVGSLPDDPQILFHGGFTGHGLGLAFYTAKCLVDMMFEREIPSFVSARRF
ncbi:MAG: NAD(P)/FAD-dependent oxidoreductase [Bdellovibrionales bacterium]